MRKSATVRIDAEGRDQGKEFLITEMSAARAESWAMRAMGAMGRSGVAIPDDILAGGIVAFAAIGLKAFMSAPWSDVGPLLAEMMECVQSVQSAATRALVDDDIEEIGTRIKLRDEVLSLHVGFSLATALLQAVAEAPSPIPASSTTPTSADPLEPSSPVA